MTIGANDRIDQLLVQKYSNQKVDNHDMVSMIDPEKMLSAMNDYSNVSKYMFNLNTKLNAACSAIKAINTQYRAATFR